MYKKHFISGLLFFLVYSFMFSQNQKQIDSLLNVLSSQKDTIKINTYRQLFRAYIFVDSKLAKPYLDSSLVLSHKLDNKDFIARTTNELGVYYNMTSNYDNAIKSFQKAIKLYETLDNKERVSAMLNNMANAQKSMGYFKDALETHMKSLKIKEEINVNDESKAASYWNIGNLQGDIGNYEESNQYYRKAEAIYEKLNLIDDLESIRANLAINLKNTKNYKEAIVLFKHAITYNKSKNYHNDLAGAYDNLGQLYLATDSLTKAKDNFEKSLDISKDYGETSLIGLTYRNLGQVFMKEKKYNNALDYFKRALSISEETKTRKKMINDYLALANVYAEIRNYKEAYNYQVKYSDLHHEILKKENIETMNELEIKYQSEKKEKTILKQDNEIKTLDQKNQKAESDRKTLFLILLSSLIIGITIVYGLRQKMKRNKLEREKLNASLVFKEKELTSHALHLAHKNDVLHNLKAQIKDLKFETNNRQYQNIINSINLDINNDTNWEQFRLYFEEVHKGFNAKVKQSYPEISTNDLRLITLLKMNLSSKEIASILNISHEGVKKARYRLRKKLKLSSGNSLEDTIMNI